ncbi:MAG: GNAT family N-acetyltransferase [Firmicutes bacterium]|nr:GNAT family N-acetyltransferase [Bacillota bacterium]
MEPIADTDIQELVLFLKRDYANNLYFFTYLDGTGWRKPREPGVTVLVGRETGAITVAILISPVHCCVSASHIDVIERIAEDLPEIRSAHVLGRSDFTLKLLDVATGPQRKVTSYAFCKLGPRRLLRRTDSSSLKASPADIPDLIRFYRGTDMLLNCETRLPSILGFGTVYFVRQDGEVVSCALTTTETADMAMVGSVYTSPSYRRKGFARDCTLSLCRDLVSRGKEVYLLHQQDNPVLSRMYHDIGFDRIGSWVMATAL